LSRDRKQIGVLTKPQLGRLSTMPSSTSPFEKFMAVDSVSSAVCIMIGPDKTDSLILPPIDLDLNIMVIDFSNPKRRLLVSFYLIGEAEGIRALT